MVHRGRDQSQIRCHPVRRRDVRLKVVAAATQLRCKREGVGIAIAIAFRTGFLKQDVTHESGLP